MIAAWAISGFCFRIWGNVTEYAVIATNLFFLKLVFAIWTIVTFSPLKFMKRLYYEKAASVLSETILEHSTY